MYDRILLKSGETASVVEIFYDPVLYICDIDKIDGIDTDFVFPEQILKKI